jgi:hypothetical protein
LSAELDAVGIVRLGRPALVFDGEGPLAAGLSAMDLDDVREAGQPQAMRNHGQRAEDPQSATCRRLSRLHAGMQQCAFRRKSILRPFAIEMDQSTLARTEHEMLQCRDRQKVVFAFHGTAVSGQHLKRDASRQPFAVDGHVVVGAAARWLSLRDVLGHFDPFE